MHADQVNLERVRGLVATFAAALEEPERVGEFDALVRHTLPDR